MLAGEKNNLIYDFETSPMTPVEKRLGQAVGRSWQGRAAQRGEVFGLACFGG